MRCARLVMLSGEYFVSSVAEVMWQVLGSSGSGEEAP